MIKNKFYLNDGTLLVCNDDDFNLFKKENTIDFNTIEKFKNDLD